MSFYEHVVASLVDDGVVARDDAILVVCAGPADRDVFASAGFSNVVLSNLDETDGGVDYSPFTWRRYDAEHLEVEDGSFDWVIENAGLHHCASPHRALCEMLRVSKQGVLVIEKRDSALMRLAVRAGLVTAYEFDSLDPAAAGTGGQRNGPIPNYVYRWTEREVEKTVDSYAPEFTHDYRYFYDLRPVHRLERSGNPLKRYAALAFRTALPVIRPILKKQGNGFGFLVTKAGALQPWMKREADGIRPDLSYGRA